MIRTSLTLLCALTLAACQGAPSTAPTGGHAKLLITPSIARHIAATVTANTSATISHLEIRLKKGDVQVSSADVPQGQLTNQIGFSNLLPNTTYQVSAIAYDANNNVISDPTLSTVGVTLTNDDAPTLLTLPVKLLDRTFSGTGQAGAMAFTPGGFVTSGFGATLSGGTLTAANPAGHVDSIATGAQFRSPYIAIADAAGNVYVADGNNYCIRKIGTDGLISTIAGGITDRLNGNGYRNGSGAESQFGDVRGLALDANGHLYVADAGYSTIRRIDLNDPTYPVTVIAGGTDTQPRYGGYADGAGAEAQFYSPSALALDGNGHLFVLDYYNHRIRQIDLTDATYPVTTLAGGNSTESQPYGSKNGTGTEAGFYYPVGLAADTNGNLYVSDPNNSYSIRKIVIATREVTTFAGGFGWGSVNGPAAGASFRYPYDLAVSPTGHLLVGEYYGVRQIDLTTAGNPVSVLIGGPNSSGYQDGDALSEARFGDIAAPAIGLNGLLYLVDRSNSTIRSASPSNPAVPVVTIAGGDGTTANGQGYRNGTGLTPRYNGPTGIATDSQGIYYVADTANHVIRVASTTGVARTLAGGSGASGYVNGSATTARFASPEGTAVDQNGNTYVADTGNHAIRKITPAGVVTTIAGGDATTANAAGYVNGAGSTAQFSSPTGLQIVNGDLIVADTGNHAIRRVSLSDASHPVTTLAGGAESAANGTGYLNGDGAAAKLAGPQGLMYDAANKLLYVADAGNHAVRSIDFDSTDYRVRTVAGATSEGLNGAGYLDGSGAEARFSTPRGLTLDGSGNLYVSDTGNHTIRKIRVQATGKPVTTLAGGDGTTANALGFANGAGPSVRFSSPVGLALAGKGSQLVVVDSGNHVLRILN